MEFNSYIFLLVFMPIVVLVYWILSLIRYKRISQGWVIAASVFFICYKDVRYLIFILISGALNYLCTWLQLKFYGNKILARFIMAIGIIGNVVALGYFKYTHFIVANLNSFFDMGLSVGEILLPMGISFLTFQQIALLVDVERGDIEEVNVFDYLFHILYFPKLVQGPITRYQDLAPQLHRAIGKRSDNFACGMYYFAIGLAKKVLLADVLGKAVAWGYKMPIDELTAPDALVVILAGTFQIYFDFSGYSHMAIGLSRMLNIVLPDNFDSPYNAKSISDFWKRWHISLTKFLTHYIYVPLGGSRKGVVRTYINTLIIFFISGLWHGASWIYIAWGMMNGILMCLHKIFAKQWEKLNDAFRWMLTFIFTMFSWTIFLAPSVEQAIGVWRRMLKVDNMSVHEGLLECFKLSEFTMIERRVEWFKECAANSQGMEIMIVLLIAMLISLLSKDKCENFKPTVWRIIIVPILFVWSVISLSSVSVFIYEFF